LAGSESRNVAGRVGTVSQGTAIAVVDGPGHGVLRLRNDGRFVYIPDPGFSGTDCFTYQAIGKAIDSDLGIATIEVPRDLDAPLIVADQSFEIDADDVLAATVVAACVNHAGLHHTKPRRNGARQCKQTAQNVWEGSINVWAPQENASTALLVDGPQHGRLEFRSDGTFYYRPDPGFSGTDAFTYRISRGRSESRIATVAIEVVHTAERETAIADAVSYDCHLD